jgi:tetratricopeptide (TPR) repeat protein
MAAAHPEGPARLHHLLGVALEWCGLDTGAAQAFRDAIKNAPGHAQTWFRLGETLARRGLWLEASEAFDEAARLQPESLECQGNLVLALARARQWDRVVDALRRLAYLRPYEGEVYVLLGGVLRKMKRNHEAIRVLRWAVRLRPSLSTKRFFLGEAILGAAGWREAQTAWLDARHIAPENEPRLEMGAGRSPLHGHPGAPLAGREVRAETRRVGRRRAAHAPSPEAFAAVLAQEKRSREILHVYRETRSFPVRHGDRPAVVHVASPATRGPGRTTADRKQP